MNHSRRDLLQALTVGAGSFAFAAKKGQAAETAPKRIVIFPIANGVVDYPDIVTNDSAGSNFTFGRMTQPLEPVKSETVILDNLEFVLPRTDIDYHAVGLIEVLTGAFPKDHHKSGMALNMSLDRYLAKRLGSELPVPQLNMGCMCDAVTYSYDATGAGVPSNRDPLDIFAKVFGRLVDGGVDPAFLRRLARRKSVLDSISGDLASFQRRLGPEDKLRAELQLTTIAEMEKRIAAGAKVDTNCTKPVVAADIDYKSAQYVPETMRAFIDLAVAAMACDQTRVVLMHSYLREYHPPNYKCPWQPANRPFDDFHGLSHDTAGDNFASFVRAKGFFFTLAAELAIKLKQIPELGGNMLDNTIIFIPTEIGRGHTSAGLQFVTIGGRGLGVKTGQCMKLGTSRSKGGGVPHQRLLVSLLNALGVPDETFGVDPGRGGLPGFLA